MGLILRKGPERGRNMVGRALHDLRGPPDPNAVLGGAGVDLSEPLPLYRLALDQITDRDCLARAEHMGWRYLIESQGKAAFADVKEGADTPVRFASLSQNANAHRLIEATHLSEAAATGEDYEPRILDVPSLRTSALWLMSRDSIFIPFIDVKRLKGAPVQIEEDFLDDLIRRAARARTAGGGPAPQVQRGG